MKQKTYNSIETLRIAFPRSATIDSAISKLKAHLAILTRNPPDTLSRLMGIEGGVAVTYFAAWRTYPLKWQGLDRHPIPDEWRQIGRRVSKVGTPSQRNRNATHPVNSILNYAYGILESQVRMQVVAAGLDPTIGYLHGDRHGKHGLVFDLMEPLRPIVDRKVLEFVQSHTFHSADFTLRSDGVCRLNPEMARSVVRSIQDRLAIAADFQKLVSTP
jgi:CRISPR-associated endonuclease Cas1